METNGKNQVVWMLTFCGIDYCSMDSNGRVKLSPKILEDFTSKGVDVVLHCLPEGAVAVYPEETYLRIRQEREVTENRAAGSFVGRQMLRRSGAWSQSERISAQGRITLPQAFREHAGFGTGSQKMVVVGVEIGIELWTPERWEAERRRMEEHDMVKRDQEMQADLNF